MKHKFCHNGHDLDIVGRSSDGRCKPCNLEWHKKRYKREKEKRLNYQQQYDKDNKDKIREKNQKYYKNYNLDRYQNDIEFKLKSRLRSRLNSAIKKNTKEGSAVKDLGCSLDFFKHYIELKFYSNMTWSNWGDVWELDHIKPLFRFDLTDKEQFKQAVRYINLQPLLIEDHRNKTIIDLHK